MAPCFIVTFTGGSCSGKKTVMAAVKSRLDEISSHKLRITCLHLSSFCKHPYPAPGVDTESIDSYDLDALATSISLYKEGTSETPADVLLVEGCYLLSHPLLLELANIKVFIDLNADARLGRRVLRDTEELKLSLDTIFDQYVRYGKHAFDHVIEPTKSLADIILPQGPEMAAIDLIAMALCDDIYAEKGGLAGRPAAGGRKGSVVTGSMYSPAPKAITLGEVDIENFYDPI